MNRESIVVDIFRCVLLFQLICLSWLFFRADNISQAMDMLFAIIHSQQVTNISLYTVFNIAIFAMPMFFYEMWLEWKDDQLALLDQNWPVQGVFYAAILLMLVIFVPSDPQVFIYFQF